SGYVLLATREHLSVRPIAAGETDIATAVADLRQAFTARLGRMPEFDLNMSHGLYRQLLGPVEADLAGIDRLAVAASGDMASLPFALLVTEDPGKGKSYRDAAWLIRRMAVAELPSARAFAALRGAHRAAAP